MSRRDHRWFGRIKYLAISFLLSLAVAVPTLGTPAQTAAAADLHLLDMLSAGGIAALFGPGPGNNNFQPGVHDNGRGGNSFVNDPCLDPLPPGQRGTVQSEDELAILNTSGSMGKLMVAGYNDSLGFTDRREGLSGYAYSANGGNTWIDGTGLPLVVPGPGDNLPGPHPGQDGYFGDPVIVVRHSTRTFWYASIYRSANGYFTLSVNRGRFQTVSPTTAESISNTRCLNDPAKTGIPDPPNQSLRIVWERPVEAVQPPNLGIMSMDLLDKEWLYVDQRTGELYLTYTRFAFNGMTRNAASIEMVRSFNGGQNWTAPVVIAPSSPMSFNHSTQPVTTPGGRVVVTWLHRDRDPITDITLAESIQEAYSDNDGVTWTGPITVANVNPQGEPAGYNRGRPDILNAPYIAVNKGADDGVNTASETSSPGFGDLYITYFSGRTSPPSAMPSKQADILISRSTNSAVSWSAPVKVNDDPGTTSHVFPSVQVNKNGYVYVGWLDRRNDPANELTDTWAAVSKNRGLTFSHNVLQTDFATNWFVRSDSFPNFGDYNSSDLLGFNGFVQIWADGRFRPPGGQNATPDTIFTISNGLGT